MFLEKKLLTKKTIAPSFWERLHFHLLAVARRDEKKEFKDNFPDQAVATFLKL